MKIDKWAKEALRMFTGSQNGSWEDRTCKIASGFLGEEHVRKFLSKKFINYMQVDLLFKHRDFKSDKNRDGYVLAEIKRQSRFMAGSNMPKPFDGHGLPPRQLEHRLEIRRELGVEPLLFIFEPEVPGSFFWQRMNTLNSLPDDDKFITTTNPRIIFPIEKFNQVNL